MFPDIGSPSTGMQTLAFTNKRKLLDWAERVRNLLVQHGDVAAGTAIDQALGQFHQNKFRLTLLGMVKRGKSTLLNALLGRRDDVIAPIDKLPATSVITEVSWAE